MGGFVGRRRQLAELDAMTGGLDSGLVVVTGGPGVGKTALAIHWAHRAGIRFFDGQLYVDLRGHGPGGGASLPTGAALAYLLVGLDVPASHVPADEQQAAALFRSVVADRRVMLVLDGAASADQVRLLRPGGPSSCTLVTCRDSLVGRTAYDGGRVAGVQPLDRGNAVRLLAQTAGERLVAAEVAAAVRLADLCDGLPLALRIAATALDRAARTPIADLVARMGTGDLLAALEVHDDPLARLDTVFGHSYHALDDASRRLFRLLGTLPAAATTAAASDTVLAAAMETTVAPRTGLLYIVAVNVPRGLATTFVSGVPRASTSTGFPVRRALANAAAALITKAGESGDEQYLVRAGTASAICHA
ncbi:NB-ARC domain-containing protein [Streptomyces sp. NBC_01410]|uniref:NB-ARC domain-containing protein n=1 Tax=Streptomyces sp. NBC_01410 TaxID=2903856 RepID=UPI003255B19D